MKGAEHGRNRTAELRLSLLGKICCCSRLEEDLNWTDEDLVGAGGDLNRTFNGSEQGWNMPSNGTVQDRPRLEWDGVLE